jgi:hypothetical protein
MFISKNVFYSKFLPTARRRSGLKRKSKKAEISYDCRERERERKGGRKGEKREWVSE